MMLASDSQQPEANTARLGKVLPATAGVQMWGFTDLRLRLRALVKSDLRGPRKS